ncbi:GDCCVxC domain-containing (seleno)protein [Piscinibacter sp.]|uniref:GDCCVxC domain-containing (seleno)protein n=1 Tax=Piscinibacter sp. TaxID=1903157 RepID=UPI002BCD729E|nr:GDCCVxC domain-containing (seleno)protein [Albitalea sp.]HUG26303.1 GDCCVxC domain-containing (seleno)protein [Albitalea sp.]
MTAATTPLLESVLTCPHCGHARRERMPTDACLFFYECEQCKVVLHPKAGDCCVFCSYGSVECPPVQMRRGCSSRSV